MTPHPLRRSATALAVAVVAAALAGCGSGSPADSGPSPTEVTATEATAVPAVTEASVTDAGGPLLASSEVPVVFDSPGSDPRPLREVPVTIDAPTSELRMRVTDLTYRGLVCGFTFTGERPPSPVSITVAGKTPSVAFTSGDVKIVWTDDGQTTTDSPQGDNGWNFSADATPNRNGAGWSVSIGAVTGDGPDTIPTEATCTLRSATPFEPKNGPVGYWAGFATR